MERFTGNLNRLKDELELVEAYRSTQNWRKHLILAHYHARKVEKLLDEVRGLTSKYPGLRKIVGGRGAVEEGRRRGGGSRVG